MLDWMYMAGWFCELLAATGYITIYIHNFKCLPRYLYHDIFCLYKTSYPHAAKEKEVEIHFL
jgi:hypothetical protein